MSDAGGEPPSRQSREDAARQAAVAHRFEDIFRRTEEGRDLTARSRAFSEQDLEEVEVIQDRAENLKGNTVFLNRFQNALFRAVTELRVSLVLAIPLLARGGRIITIKGLEEKPIGFEKLSLVKEIPLRGFSGKKSKLMVFQKCFT